jgi:uncharacterized protein (DUF1697 family)
LSLVVFLRGVNVGGHRVFRPALLVRELGHLDIANIGAAGTFVVRARATQAQVRAEFTRRLPFETHVMICPGRDLLRLVEHDYFPHTPTHKEVVRFVSVLPRTGVRGLNLPIQLPATGPWLVKILARENRFVVGVYRRHMKTIGYLGQLDRLLGAPATTRNWNTVTAICRVLQERGHRGRQ